MHTFGLSPEARVVCDDFKLWMTRGLPAPQELRAQDHAAANLTVAATASFRQLAGPEPASIQIQRAYGAILSFARKAAIDMLWAVSSGSSQLSPIGLQLRRLKRLCLCAPPLSTWVYRDKKRPYAPELFRGVCRQPLICPWCQFRRVAELHDAISASDCDELSAASWDLITGVNKARTHLARDMQRRGGDARWMISRPFLMTGEEPGIGGRLAVIAGPGKKLALKCPEAPQQLYALRPKTEFLQEVLPRLCEFDVDLYRNPGWVDLYLNAGKGMHYVTQYPRKTRDITAGRDDAESYRHGQVGLQIPTIHQLSNVRRRSEFKPVGALSLEAISAG